MSDIYLGPVHQDGPDDIDAIIPSPEEWELAELEALRVDREANWDFLNHHRYHRGDK